MTLTISGNTYKISDLPIPTPIPVDGKAVIQNLQNCIKIITENLKEEDTNRSIQAQRMQLWNIACLTRDTDYSSVIAQYVANRLHEELYNLIFVTPTSLAMRHFTYLEYLPKELKTNYLIPMMQADVSKMICSDRKGDPLIREYALKLGYKNINEPGRYLTNVLAGWKLLLKEGAFQTSITMIDSLNDKIRDMSARGSLLDLIELKEAFKNNKVVLNYLTSNLFDFCAHINLPQGSYINNKQVILCCIALGGNTKGLVHCLTHYKAFDLAELVLQEGESQSLNDCFAGRSPPLISLVGYISYVRFFFAHTEERHIARLAPLSLARSLLDHGAKTFENIPGQDVLALARESGCPEIIELLENYTPPSCATQ